MRTSLRELWRQWWRFWRCVDHPDFEMMDDECGIAFALFEQLRRRGVRFDAAFTERMRLLKAACGWNGEPWHDTELYTRDADIAFAYKVWPELGRASREGIGRHRPPMALVNDAQFLAKHSARELAGLGGMA